MDELDILLGEMEEGLLFIDLNQKIKRINPASEILLGREKGEVLGKELEESFGKTPFGFSIESILEAESSPEPRHVTLESAFGMERHLSVNPLFIPGRGILFLFHDLTERRRLQEMEKRTKEFHLVHHTASHIAHALKNPLSGIKGFAGLLKRELHQKEGDAYQFCLKVLEGIDSLEATLSSLLDFAKGSALKKEPVPLIPLLHSLKEFLPFKVEGDEGTIEADPLLLRVALTNLIKNGIEASSPSKEVVVKLESKDSLKIKIIDQGTGLPKEFLDHLLDRSMTTKREGHGLGLIEAKEIVEAHGGKMAIESKPNRGTTFILVFQPKPRQHGH